MTTMAFDSKFLCAMMAGANAKQAVKIACKLDIYSGGKLKCIDLSKRLVNKKRCKNEINKTMV